MSYIQVLEEGLPAFLDGFGERKDFLFMQDNVPIHGAHCEGLVQGTGYPGPPYSPDLNPIENIWAVLKRKLHKWYPELEEMAGGKDAVKEAIEQVITHCWQHLDPPYLRKLAMGMPKRVQAVIDARGWYTKY